MDTCPVCKTKDLTAHCHPTRQGVDSHPTCHWFRCRACGAVLDPDNARGVDHKQRPFRLPITDS